MRINSFKPILFLALILMFLFTACVSNPGEKDLPPETYTVSFVDWNYEVLATETVADGAGATAPVNPTREGYTFTSWDKAFDNVTANTTVQAEYTIGDSVTYTVTFVDWNDDVLATETVADGAGATAPVNPTREGYTFTGWDKAFDNVTANMTVQAEYTIGDPLTYTVTFVDWNDDVLAFETVAEGAGATAPASPTREGYTFTGWDKAFDNVTANTTVQAEYTIGDPLTYTVRFVDWNYDVLAFETVTEGAGATAPVNPTREGYTFAGWDKAFDNVTANMTVQAEYTIGDSVTYTVTFVDWNDDVLAFEMVAEGAGATAPVNPTREGYTFTGWDKAFDNVTANMTVQAEYTIGDSVTYTVRFVDWNYDVLAIETVVKGAGATAPVNPTREGYTFTGWDKAFDNVTANMTVQAEYDVNNVVNLGTAANYAILAKTGVSSVPGSAITGNIGVSPAAASYLTGFSETLDVSNSFSTSAQVTGKLYASDYAPPTPVKLTTAVGDMGTAYTDAAGRAADYTELYSGSIGGKTLTAGVYKWGNGVLINSDVTLHGGPNDVFIFQIAKGITQANGTRINLTGGVQAKNIFWQAAETVSIGTGAHFEGNILCKTNITMAANSSINGSLLAQTAVTLDQSTVVAPN